jgi:WD40 repeat protein
MRSGHTKFIRCVVYENKTKTLYSAGDDAKIKMWEARKQ